MSNIVAVTGTNLTNGRRVWIERRGQTVRGYHAVTVSSYRRMRRALMADRRMCGAYQPHSFFSNARHGR